MTKTVLRFQERVDDLRRQCQAIDRLRKTLDALSQKLQAELNFWETGIALEEIPDMPELKTVLQHVLGVLNQTSAATTSARQRHYKFGKTNVQRYAEILAELGPMHVTDLAEKAVERGIPLKKGKRGPNILIRDALTKSKRFHNFGGNYWGLVGQEPPAPSNGHKTEQPQLTPF